MLMDLKQLAKSYYMNPTAILHIGAHLAEEAEEYFRLGDPRVVWVEANPRVIPRIESAIRRYRNQEVICALITDRDGERRTFNVTNYDGMSSSVFEFDKHVIYSPDTVFTERIQLETLTVDSLCERMSFQPDLLCMDIQGAELLALRGAEYTLPSVKWIYAEVSTDTVYAGGAQMKDIDQFLSAYGFLRRVTDLSMHGGTHGDALYVRGRRQP